MVHIFLPRTIRIAINLIKNFLNFTSFLQKNTKYFAEARKLENYYGIYYNRGK